MCGVRIVTISSLKIRMQTHSCRILSLFLLQCQCSRPGHTSFDRGCSLPYQSLISNRNQLCRIVDIIRVEGRAVVELDYRLSMVDSLVKQPLTLTTVAAASDSLKQFRSDKVMKVMQCEHQNQTIT